MLEDRDNKWLGTAKKIKHYFFEDYQHGDEIETFDQVYRPVQGKKHKSIKGGKDWLKFVFKRWFYVNNFLISQNIDDFWHFDSDNMILDSLARHEGKFKPYDCTEQCNGMCMNGYVSSRSVVLKYVNKINQLFEDDAFLEEQQREFDELNENFAFTEMRAYEMFKKCKRCRAKTIQLNTIINGSTFDDVIRQEHGMEMERLRSGKEIKKVYLDSDGNFYCHEKAGNRFIKMNSLSLSWVPNDFFQIVLAQAKKRSNEKARAKTDLSQLPTLGEIYNKRYYRKLRLSKLEPFINKAKQLIDRYV